MTDIPLQPSALVALSPAALHRLRDTAGAQVLQEAGYAAGEGAYRSFAKWLPGVAGVDDPGELAAARLAEVLSRFLSTLGWGSVTVTQLSGAVMALDSVDWAEAQPGVGLQYPSCAFSSGLLADFMSRIGDAPLAVMEVECRSRGEARCRWLVGAPESLTALYEHMAQGADYLTVLGGTA
jgi:predicted hydrocarbon binding protein